MNTIFGFRPDAAVMQGPSGWKTALSGPWNLLPSILPNGSFRSCSQRDIFTCRSGTYNYRERSDQFTSTEINSPTLAGYPEENRIQMMTLPSGAKRIYQIWRLQNRRSPNNTWIPIYGFEMDAEFLEEDYDICM